MQDITTISGVISCYIFEMNDKKYYLFGDRHFSRTGNCNEFGYLCDHFDKSFEKTHTYGASCTTIGALLHNWFTYNNDHQITTNFYLEAVYTKDTLPRFTHFTDIIENRKKNDIIIEEEHAPFKDRSWLELMDVIRQPCFMQEKTGCPYYPNVHSHYIDIRIINTAEGLKHVNPFSFVLLNKVSNVLEYIRMFILNYKIILDDFLSPYGFEHFVNNIDLPDEIREEFIDNIAHFTVIKDINGKKVQMYKAAWELYRLEQKDPELTEKLTTFMYRKAGAIIHYIIDRFTKDIKNNVIDRKYYIEKYSALFMDMEIIIMDSYTLARVFLQEGSEIIIYAGNYHINVYVEFFNYLHYPLLLSSVGNNCLKMADLPKYLDANKYRTYVMEKQGTKVKNFDIQF
jgi:hypothetical protein